MVVVTAKAAARVDGRDGDGSAWGQDGCDGGGRGGDNESRDCRDGRCESVAVTMTEMVGVVAGVTVAMTEA